MINLTIKTLDSQDHKFRVPDTFTILELKEHIAEQVNIAVVQQRLIFCGRVMSNEMKLADIGIDGKVMHLVQKVPRLATTTSGTTSSTTTSTNSRSGQNGGPGFRGWHTHDPTVLFGAIGIPSDFIHAGEIPRLLSASARNHGAGNRVALAIDMIRRANEVLNRLENPQTAGRSTANDGEQLSEESQQTEESSRNVPLESSSQESPVQESPIQESSSQEPSSIPTQPDSESLNVSYEVDETFPNTVVVTIDATHHMRMPPGLMRHMQSHMQGNNSHSPSQNVTEHAVESEVIPEIITVGSSNQPSADQATRTSANSEQNVRNDRQTSERSSAAIHDRRRLRELIEQLNSLNARLQPFYAQYCQYINDDPHFETAEGENGSQRAQIVFNGVSEVMHFISHIYHAISDLRVAFSRPPPRSFQSRPCLLQGTILHTAHSVTTSTSNAASSPVPSSQQPTSTQTTTTNQSIPSVRALRVDFMNPEGVVRNVSTSATSTDTNTNMPVDSNTENNSTASEFSSETPHGVELMFDLTPGSIRIDSVEASFVNPNASGSSQPTAVSQPQSSSENSNNTPIQSIDWMDQMIDVISSGVRRPFMPDQPLDWSIPTTSTRTPRVTPRTTDSSSTSNPPSQGFSRGRWDSPRMDPFLPCSSHHFESNVRPMVLARRSPQMTDRSTSGNTNTTDTSTPTSPNITTRPIIRRPSERILERHRPRYMQDSEGFLSGIHPILTWGRSTRNNTTTTPASNNGPTTGQSNNVADALAGQIRVDMESVLNTLGREVDFERVTSNSMQPPSSSGSDSTASSTNQSGRRSDEVLMTSIGDIPYFRSIEGRYVLVDLFLLIARNWTLHDMLNLCTSEVSTLRQYPVSRVSESLVDFVLDRIMLNQPPTNHNIEAAANRIYLEMVPYINIFQCSVPTRTNIDVNASFRQCILLNMRALVNYCDENRAGASNDIVASFTIFAEGLLSLIVYCCNNRSVFRLCIAAVMQFLPLPTNLHRFVMELVRQNIDQYWDNMTTYQMMSLSVIDFIVPFNSELESAQSSRGTNDEHSSQSSQSSSPILPSPENINEPLPEVVIGSQEWHHGVPSEWVPVIARDSQRQRRQGTQPPYSDAYLSGMPNKRRKIVTSSKPQGPLSQIIANNLENAMGAAGVAIKKEVTISVGADTEVQNAYTERIRKFGRSGLDMHPDFSPDRYPNASKFFYNRPN